jgi:hypothetical protein
MLQMKRIQFVAEKLKTQSYPFRELIIGRHESHVKPVDTPSWQNSDILNIMKLAYIYILRSCRRLKFQISVITLVITNYGKIPPVAAGLEI